MIVTKVDRAGMMETKYLSGVDDCVAVRMLADEQSTRRAIVGLFIYVFSRHLSYQTIVLRAEDYQLFRQKVVELTLWSGLTTHIRMTTSPLINP